jgi:hypothetical protein
MRQCDTHHQLERPPKKVQAFTVAKEINPFIQGLLIFQGVDLIASTSIA